MINRREMLRLAAGGLSASVLTVTPLIVMFILGQKYYVRGIVTTGLKGVT